MGIFESFELRTGFEHFFRGTLLVAFLNDIKKISSSVEHHFITKMINNVRDETAISLISINLDVGRTRLRFSDCAMVIGFVGFESTRPDFNASKF